MTNVPRRVRPLLAAALLASLPGDASAQTVRLAPVISPMAGLSGTPAPLQPAARPAAPLSPSAALFALTLAALPAPAAPAAVRAAPAPVAVQASPGVLAGLRSVDRRINGSATPAPAAEWRGFFDGSLQASRDAAVPTEPAETTRGRQLAPSPLTRAATPARPALGLSVRTTPAPQAAPAWKNMIRTRAFWMTAAVIVPGGFLILGAFWLYKAIAAYLRRRAQNGAL